MSEWIVEKFSEVIAEQSKQIESLKSDIEALEHWRKLALQFDNHRMTAMSHLKRLVAEPDQESISNAVAFLSEPPVPAHEIVAELDSLKQEFKSLTDLMAVWSLK